MGTLHVVVGGMFGSEGKGAVTGYLARRHDVGAVVRVAGPNAGHSAVAADGQKWALRQIPVAAVTNPDCELFIAAGSEIDQEVLDFEVAALEAVKIPIRDRLFIDPEATVITADHKAQEVLLTGAIGSTGKGIGAARADRIMRTAANWAGIGDPTYHQVEVAQAVRSHLVRRNDVVIEGTQGYGLGLHAGYYPFCTSSDCRAIDFLAMVGISPWLELPGSPYSEPAKLAIWPVFRTYPIRVAGNSGPLRREVSWEELADRTGGHIQPERTTVTQKVRRVGEWDPDLARAAMVANGAPSHAIHPVLTFLDYQFPEIANKPSFDDAKIWKYLGDRSVELGSPIDMVGTGPATMIEI